MPLFSDAIKCVKNVIKKFKKLYKSAIYFTTIGKLVRVEFQHTIFLIDFPDCVDRFSFGIECIDGIKYIDVTTAIENYKRYFEITSPKKFRYCLWSNRYTDPQVEQYANNNSIDVRGNGPLSGVLNETLLEDYFFSIEYEREKKNG